MTNRWFTCKKCKVSKVFYKLDKEKAKEAGRKFNEEHKDCESEVR